MHPQIYLASRSPRRCELLAQIGIYPKVMAADVDESPAPEEVPAEYVIRLALEKAKTVRAMLGDHEMLPVLAADTAVVTEHKILGKPADRDDALAMMRQLSGRSHKVLTAVALVDTHKRCSRLSVSHVTFRQITAAEALAYWDSGEPQDKAGGYAIQGLGAVFVSHLEGSYSGVMGLPLFETAELLHAAGIMIPHIKSS
ncbi:MAG: Maf-like protein [Candidatus Polarisedimenticolaceae bacterium]|nr:Maf-like protein [Candidatus Polarisedimenticolaceae bacterium]